MLHAYRPSINVAAPGTSPHGNDNPNAPSNISHSPTRFILALGDAYRASGRTKRIFDTVVHHPYANTNDERPYLIHPTIRSVGEGDWAALVSTYQAAFADTQQPVPGRCFEGSACVPIWYLEQGFQTTVPAAEADWYYGEENVRTIADLVLPGEPASPPPPADTWAPDQATQLRYALRLAYCQPYVEAVFNFLVRDDPNLAGYQSGVYWRDWSPKGSYDVLRSTVAELGARSVSCAPPSAPTAPAAEVTSAGVKLSWSASSSAIGVSGYAVYRDGALVGGSMGPSFVDAVALPGSVHTYSVAGYDAAGQTGERSPVTLVGETAPPPPPVAPAPLPPAAVSPPPSAPSPVAIGPASVFCIVPNVRGKPLSAASAAIRKANCRVGRVRYAGRARRRSVVIGQSPRPRARLPLNGRVDLTLNRHARRNRG